MSRRILLYLIIIMTCSYGCYNSSKKEIEQGLQGDTTREKIQKKLINSDTNIFKDKWPVQFMIDADSFEPTIDALNSISECKFISDFMNHEISPANVHSWNAKMVLFRDTINISKMTYSDWKGPIFSFNFEESFDDVKADSKIKKIENALKQNRIEYTLIDYLKE